MLASGCCRRLCLGNRAISSASGVDGITIHRTPAGIGFDVLFLGFRRPIDIPVPVCFQVGGSPPTVLDLSATRPLLLGWERFESDLDLPRSSSGGDRDRPDASRSSVPHPHGPDHTSGRCEPHAVRSPCGLLRGFPTLNSAAGSIPNAVISQSLASSAVLITLLIRRPLRSARASNSHRRP